MEFGQIAKTVTTPGTAVPLSATSLRVRWFDMRANSTNTGKIYYGNSAVTSSDGMELYGSEPVHFPQIDENNRYDLSTIYIDAEQAGEGVRIFYAKL